MKECTTHNTYTYINVKNYIGLKLAVHRPDSTYKTAKMIYQQYSYKAEVDGWSVKGKENSMAYKPAFDRRMRKSNECMGPKDCKG